MSGLPPDEEVLRWYECERKIPLTAGEAADRMGPRVPYRCPYGDHWHVGRPRLNYLDNHAVRHGRLKNARRAWRKEHGDLGTHSR